MDIDLTHKLQDRFGTKKYTIGRYSVSNIYAIKAGWIKPEDFFTVKVTDMVGIKRMWAGTVNHDLIESLLDKNKCEQKIEYPYKDIVVVGKSDYLPNEDEVIDFKTSDTYMSKAKAWHLHQVKMYCTMFKRKRGLIYQPVIKDDKFILKHIGSVERDDEWFEKELERLYEFHEKVVELKRIRDGLSKSTVIN